MLLKSQYGITASSKVTWDAKDWKEQDGEFESPPNTFQNCSLFTFTGKTISMKAKEITNKEWVRLNRGKR